MANLTIREMATGAETPVQEVDLSITNRQLIDQLIEGEVLKPLSDSEKSESMGYIMLKDGRICDGVKPLKELGFQDGGTIEIVKKAVGA